MSAPPTAELASASISNTKKKKEKTPDKRDLESLQAELQALNKKWSADEWSQLKVVKTGTKKDASFPWPVMVQRTLPRPDTLAGRAWDVDQLVVCMLFDAPDDDSGDSSAAPPVRVALPKDQLTKELRAAIAANVLDAWKGRLAIKANWQLEKLQSWLSKNFVELLKSLPTHVETYEGVDEHDNTMRRFCVVAPVAAEDLVIPDEESEDEGDLSEGTLEKRRIAEERREMRARMKAEAIEDLASEKRMEAEAAAERGEVKFKAETKKQQDARLATKRGQGDRTSKVGARRHKFDPNAKEEGLKAKEKQKDERKKEKDKLRENGK
jgi:hypothetical protein